jgi:epoxyqueuosine reductase QueG
MIKGSPWLGYVPPLAPWGPRRFGPHFGAWPAEPVRVSAQLRGTAGIRRDAAAEEQAYRDAPLLDWQVAHPDTVDAAFRHGWAHHVPMSPRRHRAGRAAAAVAARRPAAAPAAAAVDPERLTAELKAYAAELGISACGVAAYDERYTFAEYRDRQVGDRVVVCALESNWSATQTAPSARAEKAQAAANFALSERLSALGAFLQDRGYAVKLGVLDHVVLHYAVEAGLGQLGMNGQVLTPHAGSRCRFVSLNTNAPLAPDAPVDYGVNEICDRCQVCVRRCPAGAIPNRRGLHRGVEKAKINSARCAPVVVKVHQCAVCMKVCPVQRYGLQAVADELERSGEILGKGTPELESYRFEGVRYGPGERPRLRPEWFAEIPYGVERPPG